MKQIPKQITTKEESFFKTPRTMQEIISYFNGDQWRANHFQNDMLNSNQLTTIVDEGEIKFVRPLKKNKP